MHICTTTDITITTNISDTEHVQHLTTVFTEIIGNSDLQLPATTYPTILTAKKFFPIISWLIGKTWKYVKMINI